MAKRAKRMKPWLGWCVVNDEGAPTSDVCGSRWAAKALYLGERSVRVLVTEAPAKKKAKRKAVKRGKKGATQ